MTTSFTRSESFTRTHAVKLASKVTADLYQCHLLYGRPSEEKIEAYKEELTEMLANEYVSNYEFGFKKEDKRVVSWRYAVGADGGLHGDSNAGNIYGRATVADSVFFNYMWHSKKWDELSEAQRDDFEGKMPFRRTTGAAPIDGDGYWQTDHGYTAGGVLVERKTYRPR